MTEQASRGQNVEFPTGAVREGKQGKGDYSLLPPFATHQLAKLMQDNCERIGARNWENGLPLSSYIDSGYRHLNEYMMFMDDENHLLRAAWNLMCAVDTVERVKAGLLPAELLDCGAYGKLYVEPTAEQQFIESFHSMFMQSDYVDPTACPNLGEACSKSPCPDCVICLVPSYER